MHYNCIHPDIRTSQTHTASDDTSLSHTASNDTSTSTTTPSDEERWEEKHLAHLTVCDYEGNLENGPGKTALENYLKIALPETDYIGIWNEYYISLRFLSIWAFRGGRGHLASWPCYFSKSTFGSGSNDGRLSIWQIKAVTYRLLCRLRWRRRQENQNTFLLQAWLDHGWIPLRSTKNECTRICRRSRLPFDLILKNIFRGREGLVQSFEEEQRRSPFLWVWMDHVEYTSRLQITSCTSLLNRLRLLNPNICRNFPPFVITTPFVI